MDMDIYLSARRHRYLITAQIKMGRPSINKTKVFVWKITLWNKILKIFGLTTFTFGACWFPLIYINLVGDVLLMPQLAPMEMLEISLHTIFESSLINPIVYGYFQKNIRKFIKIACSQENHQRFRRSTYDSSGSSIPLTNRFDLSNIDTSNSHSMQNRDV